jgi:peptidoglycan/xylan/chitin deacetylase (PgdA/CDA1 family)
MRLDRLATLHLFHPIAVRRVSKGLRVPILMYHSISDAQEFGHAYFHTSTSPSRFSEHMEFLAANGYTAVSLTKVLDLLSGGTATRITKPVVITFDDGFRDFHTHAFPVLAKHRFTANMFLPTAFVSDRRSKFNGAECLTWSEVRELRGAGVEFGSHTMTHPRLRDLSIPEVEKELRCSKETIEDKLGVAISSFSYPYAFPETLPQFVGELRQVLLRCDYGVGVSTVIGAATAADDRYFLRRLPVNSADDLALFQAKLEGGYDWLHGFQLMKKRFAGARAS